MITSQEKLAEQAAVDKVRTVPRTKLEAQIQARMNEDGTPMTQTDFDNSIALFQLLYGKPDPYQFLLPQAK